jgi:hypothetical protein
MQVLHAQATVLMRYTSQIKTSSKSFRQHVGHAYSHRSRHACLSAPDRRLDAAPEGTRRGDCQRRPAGHSAGRALAGCFGRESALGGVCARACGPG